MAETVHLTLKHQGKQIEGESTQHTLGRDKTIECVSYAQHVQTAREAGSAMATGRRQHMPIVITKRIDKSSPILMKALTDNQSLEAEFKFFRPNPSGDGTTEQFYTVVLKDARISEIKQHVPDAFSPAAHAAPPMEEVQFVFHTINWTFNPSGAQHEDKWSGGK
jgi:type VI secretion system secreted protein Hcp